MENPDADKQVIQAKIPIRETQSKIKAKEKNQPGVEEGLEHPLLSHRRRPHFVEHDLATQSNNRRRV